MASKNGRNAGMPLDLDWVAAARVNRSAVERRRGFGFTSDYLNLTLKGPLLDG